MKFKSLSERFTYVEKTSGKNTTELAAIFGVERRQYANYKAEKGTISDIQWDAFERETKFNRTWVSTGKGQMMIATSDDVLQKLGEEVQLLNKLKNLKLAVRLSQIPEDIPPSKLKLLQNLLDLYLETIK
ncbi:hypothetical protein CH379_018080 [Leptospira ellisii]|uniref:Uncharacterized protein n=1 Tax=Leptospira ellisii TaxID=2023197 RepID=A0A2N0BGI2_9LEPT|nr:hypothetical protein [Leptospira ellisii]MDV6237545.1 hypothetical protein [Leptospira ellisii]PJZ92804.1 hypothetical protein CH379_11125 [Leptospira ellisii]PKA03111.1 hypothetical protein CH375_18940 [Leptospira ellisii]